MENMDFLKDSTGALYRKFLFASVCSALVMSVYSFVDTIAVGQSEGTLGAAALFGSNDDGVYRAMCRAVKAGKIRSNDYSVSVGRIGKLECDFILRKDIDYAYLQICMTIMSSPETEEREYRPLESIKDNYPKYVLTRCDPIQHRNGIIHKNLPDLMKGGELF